jgi:hypothetical protein
MVCQRVVEERMVTVASTATIEATQADVKASFIVYGIKTLCAVFAVDTLVWSGRTKVLRLSVRTRHDGAEGATRSLELEEREAAEETRRGRCEGRLQDFSNRHESKSIPAALPPMRQGWERLAKPQARLTELRCILLDSACSALTP